MTDAIRATPQQAPSAFMYRAVAPNGKIERGTLTARSREEALAALIARGLWSLDIAPQGVARRLLTITRGHSAGAPMPVDQLALGLRILADFLDAGLPIARALGAMQELAPPAWRADLPSVREAIRQGRALSLALTSGTHRFPALVLGIIRAGEAGSGLVLGVRGAAAVVEEAAATRSAIRAALAYPIVLAAAGVVSLVLLVGVVLPRFAAILTDLGQKLPATTALVMRAGMVVRGHAVSATLAIVLTVIAWRMLIGTAAGHRRWHELLLLVPLVGAVRRASATSRLCAALGALLDNGVPMSRGLTEATAAIGDHCLARRLTDARTMVLRGERLSDALLRHSVTTPTAVRLARAGEETGRLGAMLAHAARLEREYALQRTRNLVRLLEPTLVVLFGGVVALVAAALLQALYSVRPPT